MPTDFPSPAGPAERTIPRTGSQIIVDALLAHRVDAVFGYLRAFVSPLFDGLYESPIRFIIPCHEQGRVRMADACASWRMRYDGQRPLDPGAKPGLLGP